MKKRKGWNRNVSNKTKYPRVEVGQKTLDSKMNCTEWKKQNATLHYGTVAHQE